MNTKNLAFILLCEISKCFFKIIALAFGLCFDILRLFTVQRISMVIMKKFYKDSCFLTLCVPYDTCGLNCYFSSFRKSFLFSLNEGLQIIFKSTMDKQKTKQNREHIQYTVTEQLSVQFLKNSYTGNQWKRKDKLSTFPIDMKSVKLYRQSYVAVIWNKQKSKNLHTGSVVRVKEN